MANGEMTVRAMTGFPMGTSESAIILELLTVVA
jgi:hypothetical protein